MNTFHVLRVWLMLGALHGFQPQRPEPTTWNHDPFIKGTFKGNLETGNPSNIVGMSWEYTYQGPYSHYKICYIPTTFLRFSVLGSPLQSLHSASRKCGMIWAPGLGKSPLHNQAYTPNPQTLNPPKPSS